MVALPLTRHSHGWSTTCPENGDDARYRPQRKGRFVTTALASASSPAITSARPFFDPVHQGRTNVYAVVNS